ncbi:MAG: DUF2721 domain-containing protein [Chitinophagia bacterium]|jgi:hypothetical protein|nr:DUF2721 domain-containing protein [Chitinophagia bacterium]NCA29705.1 DUF2721 domain-containing protein [Chitinophagia bacterium]NDD15386.1 DUF2721 domain-containing protein [Chitinophagia bacterium]
MELSVNIPALLFPAISLIMLAYTNRFLALSNRVRVLHDKYHQQEKGSIIFGQIKNLKYRIKLIQNMQTYGVATLLLSILCMFFIFIEYQAIAKIIFALSLISFSISIFLSLIEIRLSTKAIELELSDMEGLEDPSVMEYLRKKFERE